MAVIVSGPDARGEFEVQVADEVTPGIRYTVYGTRYTVHGIGTSMCAGTYTLKLYVFDVVYRIPWELMSVFVFIVFVVIVFVIFVVFVLK